MIYPLANHIHKRIKPMYTFCYLYKPLIENIPAPIISKRIPENVLQVVRVCLQTRNNQYWPDNAREHWRAYPVLARMDCYANLPASAQFPDDNSFSTSVLKRKLDSPHGNREIWPEAIFRSIPNTRLKKG